MTLCQVTHRPYARGLPRITATASDWAAVRIDDIERSIVIHITQVGSRHDRDSFNSAHGHLDARQPPATLDSRISGLVQHAFRRKARMNCLVTPEDSDRTMSNAITSNDNQL